MDGVAVGQCGEPRRLGGPCTRLFPAGIRTEHVLGDPVEGEGGCKVDGLGKPSAIVLAQGMAREKIEEVAAGKLSWSVPLEDKEPPSEIEDPRSHEGDETSIGVKYGKDRRTHRLVQLLGAENLGPCPGTTRKGVLDGAERLTRDGGSSARAETGGKQVHLDLERRRKPVAEGSVVGPDGVELLAPSGHVDAEQGGQLGVGELQISHV